MEDYKEKYEQALERAKVINPGTADYEVAVKIFPELKSEDERIKKEIIECLKNNALGYPEQTRNKWFAWLEKQREMKPQGNSALEIWKDIRLEVYQQASGNRHEPNHSDDSTKMFSLTDIDEIFEKITEKQGEQNNKHLYDVIIALWDLLDKIDTFSDLQIDDTNPDNPFKKIEYIAQERHKFVKSDGYNLYIQGEQITDFKQSKQKPADKCIGCNNFKGCITCTDGDQYAHLTEQKPTDKVESKFKVGDWIYHERSGNTFRINKIENDLYVSDEGATISLGRQNNWRLWTIQDAEDGDVLCDYYEGYNNPLIFILKKFEHVNFGLVKPSDYSSYCFLTAGDRQKFEEGSYYHKCNIKPATKEQRDQLEKAMKEAGYEWDAKKKELKKIEQKSTWSEEDEEMTKCVLISLEFFENLGKDVIGHPHPNYFKVKHKIYPDSVRNWLKSLKERMKGE